MNFTVFAPGGDEYPVHVKDLDDSVVLADPESLS